MTSENAIFWSLLIWFCKTKGEVRAEVKVIPTVIQLGGLSDDPNNPPRFIVYSKGTFQIINGRVEEYRDQSGNLVEGRKSVIIIQTDNIVLESVPNSKFTFGVNFRISTDFENRFIAKGNSGFSSFDSFPLDENENPIVYDISESQEFSNFYNGELSELNFVFSGVYQEKLHVGAGLNFYDINFSQQIVLKENNNDGFENTLTSRFYQENFTNGVGFSMSAGFIYKPTKAFRIGLSYQSPTWYTELIENTNIINNDGFLDIYVCKSGSLESHELRKNRLYVNQQNNTFKNITPIWINMSFCKEF